MNGIKMARKIFTILIITTIICDCFRIFIITYVENYERHRNAINRQRPLYRLHKSKNPINSVSSVINLTTHISLYSYETNNAFYPFPRTKRSCSDKLLNQVTRSGKTCNIWPVV